MSDRTIDRIVILGATGDLTQRMLVPAIAVLRQAALLPGSARVVAVGRRDWGDEEYLDWLASKGREDAVEALRSMLSYRKADVSDADELGAALEPLDAPVVVYLALPPDLFEPTLEALASCTLPEGSRIVVEKPFGDGAASAARLNELVHAALPEDSVYRIDHFLHKQTVQNIIGLRFANRLIEPLWCAEHIERVDIIWDETIGLEGRAGYYDGAGALRDMVQNHLLQLLALVVMEEPATLEANDLRDRKVEALRRVRRPAASEVRATSVRARYTAGEAGGRSLPDYADEDGVDPARETETFASIELYVDDDRWAGVPFTLRTGKALAEARREVLVRFRQAPGCAFGQEHDPVPNHLRLSMEPDEIALRLNINGPGDPFDLEQVDIDVRLSAHELPPYARLLEDVLEGDPTLSIRDDEAVEQWRIIEPILGAWRDEGPPLRTYPAGSDGPE
jgi:glucose-6-phosphate 1-dehydrogenase